jgi:WD40 repeat protein
MRWCFASILLLFIGIGTLPVIAQEAQCIEFLAERPTDTVYQVNLDTGAIASYELPTPTATNTVNPEPYTTMIERNESPEFTYRLTLTDNRMGISVVLAPVATTYRPHWSPDGRWLAYVERDESENLQYLRLYNAETGEVISTTLEGEHYTRSWVDLSWSPDSGHIIVRLFVENGDSPRAEMRVYTVPDLVYVTTYSIESHAPTLPFVSWSPSGNYFGVDSTYGTVDLVDTSSWEIYAADVENVMIPLEYFWSPDETYLAIASFDTDLAYERLNVVNMQGESVIGTTTINKVAENLRWLNDDQLLAATDELPEHEGAALDPYYDLTLFDLQTGAQHLILEQPSVYVLSQDQRYLAGKTYDDHYQVQLFDFMQEDQFLIESLHFDTNVLQFIWRTDRLELIVFLEDSTLRAYDLEANTWRDIAIAPVSYRWMHQVVCSM